VAEFNYLGTKLVNKKIMHGEIKGGGCGSKQRKNLTLWCWNFLLNFSTPCI
jgi:hypothetical protein